MNVTVQSNKCVVSLGNQLSFSRARNRDVSARTEITFEFFEIGQNYTPFSMDIEAYVSQQELETFLFLLTVDFKDYTPGQFESSAVDILAKKTYRRLSKEPVQQAFAEVWPDVDDDSKFIFFGGGVDSRAVAGLYPEARRVVLDTTLYTSYRLRAGDVFIRTNLKSGAFDPRGFVFWSQPFAVAPILASYYGCQRPVFMIGSILGSSYLMNGRKYFNREARSDSTFGVTGNMYHSLFNELGLPLYAPLANCSEYVSTKVEILTGDNSEKNPYIPAFCQANRGAPCLKCFKCLRKVVERCLVAKSLDVDLSYSDFSTVECVLDSLPSTRIDFSYFYHVWNYAALESPEISTLLAKRGFKASEVDKLELNVVYSDLERFYQSDAFSTDKLSRLERLGVRPASSDMTVRLKAYNPGT